jgi:signal peptidase II
MPAKKFFTSEARVAPGSPRERRMIIAAAVTAIILVILDQVTKTLVLNHIKLHERITVIPGFFDLTHLTNKGAAWGMFHDFPWIPSAISIAALVLLILFLRKLAAGWPERFFAMLMVASGIVGNCTDRVLHGAVIDFLRFHWQNAAEWPSFNVADSAICCGVALYVISSFFRPETKSEAKRDDAGDAPKSA